MNDNTSKAPGAPGIPGRWTSSAKSGVGTALNNISRVWFTVSHGIINEVYYPRVDQACIRDIGFLVAGNNFFSEEKRNTAAGIENLAPGVPAYKVANECSEGKYKIEKEILSDPVRDSFLQKIKFSPSPKDLRLYMLVSPHLGNCGAGNTGWIGDYKGVPMLFASRGSSALAVACSAPFVKRSAGFVGESDGWQDIKAHNELTAEYQIAENGNVALTAEIDYGFTNGTFTVAVGFGQNWQEAAQRARASLLDGFETAKNIYINEWNSWFDELPNLPEEKSSKKDLYRISAAVLRTHEAKRFPGGLIASLSVPWGFSKGDDDLGGYHLVWPRDLAESAGGLLALRAYDDALRVLNYLYCTQEGDGHWDQNMWLDGSQYWAGIQMDETAFPILLVDMIKKEGVLDDDDLKKYWSMVKKAAQFLVKNGPVTQQDRWEEDAGYSPFTLAVEISALLAAADMADSAGENKIAGYLRETADYWNENIERWTYAVGSDIAENLGVEGYYVRISSPEVSDSSSPSSGFVNIKNRPPGKDLEKAVHIISPDALSLVRFGLRSADDPRIVNTVKAIDSLLKVETPNGPAWHRYNDDGYGEHDDGSPFDGTGTGRAWPLLTGERAHYELAAGNTDEARRLLEALENFSNEGGMIPEQVWDSEDIPERELFFGRPAGSAMPLVWAHAEYIKLKRSIETGKVFDMPSQTVERYINDKTTSRYFIWRFNNKCREFPAGKILRIETSAEAIVHWSSDNWTTVHDSRSSENDLGIHLTELPSDKMKKGTEIKYTFYWPVSGKWENEDFTVVIN